jgi:hypothetical protein
MEKGANQPSDQESSQMAGEINIIDYKNGDKIDSSNQSKQ